MTFSNLQGNRPMASRSYNTFNKHNLRDVRGLMEAHDTLSPEGRGRRNLGYITRSAIVILCASWEQYIEDVVMESVEMMCSQFDDPAKIPKHVKKKIVKHIESEKDDLSPLTLAADGWRNVYKKCAKDGIGRFHSPKTDMIIKIFRDYMGITSNVSECWSIDGEELDRFVDFRNTLAHRGQSYIQYVRRQDVQNYLTSIDETARETEAFLSNELSNILPQGRPWIRPYRRRS